MARDQTQPGSFSRGRGEPGYEVGMNLVNGVILLLIRSAIFLVSVKPQQEKSIHSTKIIPVTMKKTLTRICTYYV